jgi:hypothetical protein
MIEKIQSRLKRARGRWCGPVAVGALTGASPRQVLDALSKAANEEGRTIDASGRFKVRDQGRAVEILGFDLYVERARSFMRSK